MQQYKQPVTCAGLLVREWDFLIELALGKGPITENAVRSDMRTPASLGFPMICSEVNTYLPPMIALFSTLCYHKADSLRSTGFGGFVAQMENDPYYI